MKAKIAKLLEVKSIVTLSMTGAFIYILVGDVQLEPELLALFSTSYGSVITYFFTRKSGTDSTNI